MLPTKQKNPKLSFEMKDTSSRTDLQQGTSVYMYMKVQARENSQPGNFGTPVVV